LGLAALIVLVAPTATRADEGAAADQSVLPPPLQAFGELPASPTAARANSSEQRSSEDKYDDLSAAEALALLEAEFSSLVAAKPIPELELGDGQSVDSYLGTFTALIDIPGETTQMLAESTTPLRAPEGGALRPLDGELVAEGDHYEAQNPLTETEISADPSDGIAFKQAGVEVSVAAGSDAVQEVSEKLFFANADASATAADPAAQPDGDLVDILITPLPAGAEVAYQLRGPEAPQDLALEFSLPAGAKLSLTDDEGAEVSGADGAQLVEIAPPVAFDAEGTAVAVSYRVEGDRLVVAVEHQGRELVWPVMVDPPVNSYYGNIAEQQNLGLFSYYNLTGAPGFTWSREWDGLQLAARNGYSYPWSNWTAAEFRAESMRDSFIEQIAMYDFDRYVGYPASCTFVGIYSPVRCNWEPGNVTNPYGQGVGQNGKANQTMCDPAGQQLIHDWRDIWVGWDKNPENWVYDDTGTSGNYAAFGLVVAAGERWDTTWNRLRGAQIIRYDSNDPAVWFRGNLPPSTWRNDNGALTPFYVTGSDAGLGIKSVALRDTGSGSRVAATHSCNGRYEARCPQYWDRTLSMRLSEGKRRLELSGTDIIGRGRAANVIEQRIDRTPPNVPVPQGSLYTSRDDIVAELGYTLDLFATDGSRSSDAAMRSGAEQIDVKVDGVTRYSFREECTHPDGSCELKPSLQPGARWSVPERFFEPGTHQIEIVATDGLGHRSPAGSRVFTINVRSDEDESDVTLQPGPPAADGSYDLQITATDGQPIGGPKGSVGTGVVSIEVFVDGVVTHRLPPQSCPNGGCSMTRTVRMSGAQSAQDHELAALAYDGAENSGIGYGGRKREAYELFGFNDDFPARRLDDALSDPVPKVGLSTALTRATQGGANVIRFPVSWCRIVGSDPEDSSPDDWGWQEQYGAGMDAISQRNTDQETNNDIQTIPVLFGSPYWASRDDDAGRCADAPPPPEDPFAATAPPNTDHNDDWGDFIGGFLTRWGPQVTGTPEAPKDYGVIAIEVWNEPNLDVFWGTPEGQPFSPNANRFAKLVDLAYDEVVALGLQDGLTVLPGGLSPDGTTPKQFMTDSLNRIRELNPDLAARLKLSIHLYANGIPSTKRAGEVIGTKYEDLVAGAAAAGYGSTHRWITEIGFPSAKGGRLDPPRASEKTQRQRLLEAYLRFSDNRKVKAFLVHRLIDDPEPSGENNLFGVIRANNSHRAVYCKLAKQALPANRTQPPGC